MATILRNTMYELVEKVNSYLPLFGSQITFFNLKRKFMYYAISIHKCMWQVLAISRTVVVFFFCFSGILSLHFFYPMYLLVDVAWERFGYFLLVKWSRLNIIFIDLCFKSFTLRKDIECFKSFLIILFFFPFYQFHLLDCNSVLGHCF